jgi:hypothetical protein
MRARGAANNTRVGVFAHGASHAKTRAMLDTTWDEPATLIDLDGKTPIIGTVRDCVMHFAIFKPFAKEAARMLLTRPVHREGRKTRVWLLNPDEIEQLIQRLNAEKNQLN